MGAEKDFVRDQLHDHPHPQIASSPYSLSLPFRYLDNGTLILLVFVFVFIVVQAERHHIAGLSHRFRFSVSRDFSCCDAIRVGGYCDWVCAVAFGDGFGVGFLGHRVCFQFV